jgi:tRNA(Ile)-lysidine synthase
MDLKHRFLKNLESQEQGSTLLGVSGGLDSVVLAHLYANAYANFTIAHCNFQLRGDESEADVTFVEDLANKLGVPFVSRSFDTIEVAFKYNLSIQMAARELRYRWFESLMEEFDFQRIATAHHLNDSIETALLNYTKGTGLKGLGGIRMLNNKKVFRPLINVTKDEIATYAKKHNLIWREDSSNASDKYQRNHLRLNVVPALETINPSFLHTAASNMKRIQETSDAFDFLAEKYFKTLIKTTGNELSIQRNEIENLPGLPTLLYKWLEKYGLNDDQIRQLSEHIISGRTLELETEEQHISLTRKELIIGSGVEINQIISIKPDDLMLTLPDETKMIILKSSIELPYPDGKMSVLINADLLKYPLTLRHWKAGDTFQPFGMKGMGQKLQDFFINHKLSPKEKDRQWILVNADDTIIWLPGMRLDHRFRIQENTQNALKINWSK